MNGGVLALWNDCAPGQESAYEHWYQTEHLFERVGIAGSRSSLTRITLHKFLWQLLVIVLVYLLTAVHCMFLVDLVGDEEK